MKIIQFTDRIETEKNKENILPGENFPGENQADQIYFSARDRIIASGVFYRTPAAAAAVEKVNQTYKDILSGGTDFNAMHIACEEWIAAATKQPEEIENEKLPGV